LAGQPESQEDPAPTASGRTGGAPDGDEPLIATRGLSAGYGAIAVVRDINIEVRRGQVVALLGPNGAGKSTTVLSLAGELKPLAGGVYSKGVREYKPLFRRARSGLAYVGEERSVFMTMTVAENLRVARSDTAIAYSLFPELKPLSGRRTGLLSGGEQQMLALARVLGRQPSLLLADELSLGLAPLVIDRLLTAVREAADKEGLGVLLVEQHVEKALHYADYVYVLRRGEIIIEGTAASIRGRVNELQDSYLSTH
jgi:branched-chain amino acid transport system ATP-binding protein